MRRNNNAALLFAVRGAPKIRKKPKPRKKVPRKPKKSSFVRFFESLEERGPLSPIEGQIYDRWTRIVRREMEAVCTWPKDKQKTEIEIVAEYVSRLMRQFWKSSGGRKWYKYLGETRRLPDKLKTNIKVFGIIYSKIRNKGQRDKSFELALATTRVLNDGSIRKGWLDRSKTSISIIPYTPFNNQAIDI